MAGRIPEPFIQDLLSRVDIVEVIQSRVQVKKAGREFHALCPFHDENTASFTISPTKQFYHCFGCQAHGNAIGFIMEYERLGFIDAVEELARLAGMEVPREAGSQPRDDHSGLYQIMQSAQHYFRQQLAGHPEAIAYLKNRGISSEIARDYGIGFAPAGWDGLIQALNPNRQGDIQTRMEQTGLLSSNDSGRVYDKFRKRIMFPIHDTRGRPIAFGGRVIDLDDSPKYLNSPETTLFHKGRQLYGLYQIKQMRARPERLIVVEGYMDVVALAQFGIGNSVATLGTATTTEHAEILFRSCHEVVFCFDGDRAGRQAAVRAMEAVIPRLRDGRQCRFLLLPDGEDPDTRVREIGQQRFEAEVASATPLSEFFFDHFSDQVDMSSLDGRSRFVEQARPALMNLPEGSFRDLMFERLADLARTQVRLKPDSGPASRPRDGRGASVPGSKRLVRIAVSCLLQDPGVCQKIDQAESTLQRLEALDRPGVPLLIDLIRYCREGAVSNAGQILEHWRGRPEAVHLGRLLSQQNEVQMTDLQGEFDGCLARLTHEARRQQLDRLQRRIHEQGHRSLSDEQRQLFRQLTSELS